MHYYLAGYPAGYRKKRFAGYPAKSVSVATLLLGRPSENCKKIITYVLEADFFVIET